MKVLLTLAALCASCVVDAEVSAVCATRHDVEVAPAAARSLTLAVDVTLTEDELATVRALDPGLRFRSVRLHPTSGIDDLGFVDAATITAQTSAQPAITVGACDGDCAGDRDLVVSAASEVDALAYLSAGTLTLGGTIEGDLPTVAWTMDVEVCAESN